jgi:hypothetical protein
VLTVPEVLWDSYLELVLINEDGTPLESRTLSPQTVVRIDPGEEYALAFSRASLSLLRVEDLDIVWHVSVQNASPDSASGLVLPSRELVALLHPRQEASSRWTVSLFDLASGEVRNTIELPPEPAGEEQVPRLLYREAEDELVVEVQEGEICLNVE